MAFYRCGSGGGTKYKYLIGIFDSYVYANDLESGATQRVGINTSQGATATITISGDTFTVGYVKLSYGIITGTISTPSAGWTVYDYGQTITTTSSSQVVTLSAHGINYCSCCVVGK